MIKQITYRIELSGAISIFDRCKDINKKILALTEIRPFTQFIYKNLYYYERYEAFYIREN